MKASKTVESGLPWLLEQLKESKGISEHNRQLINDFINIKQQQHKDLSTIKGYLFVLLPLAEQAGTKDLESFCKTERVMVEYFASLKPRQALRYGSKVIFKERKKPFGKSTLWLYQNRLIHFLKWLYKLDKKAMPESMRWVSRPPGLGNNLKKEDILSVEEIQAMIDSCANLRDKAIVHALFESMNRNSEFLQWNIGSLEVAEDFARINVKGKGNIDYTAYIVNSLPAVKLWIENHPFKSKKDAPLWCSLSPAGYGKRLTKGSLNVLLKQIAKRAGIKKKVYAHLFRHSGITLKVRQGYNTELLKKMVGHKRASNMIAATYSHLANEDAEEEVKRKCSLKGAKQITPELERLVCPRCKAIWPPGQKYCTCNYIFDVDEIKRKEAEQKNTFKEMINEALNQALKDKAKTILI